MAKDNLRNKKVDWPGCGETVHYYTGDEGGLIQAWPAILLKSWMVEGEHYATLWVFRTGAPHLPLFFSSAKRGLNKVGCWERISISGDKHIRDLSDPENE